jgi:hypothetical protein
MLPVVMKERSERGLQFVFRHFRTEGLAYQLLGSVPNEGSNLLVRENGKVERSPHVIDCGGEIRLGIRERAVEIEYEYGMHR